MLLAWLPGAFDMVFVVSFCTAMIGLGVILCFVENPAREARVDASQTFSVQTVISLFSRPGFRGVSTAGSDPVPGHPERQLRVSDAAAPAGLASLHGQLGLLFVSAAFDVTNSRLRFASSGLTDAGRSVGELRCDRVHVAADAGICLVADRGLFTTYRAHTFGLDLKPRHTIALAGAPSRVCLSPDGRRAAMTAFVSGDSYNATGFSTGTTIVDMNTGTVLGSNLSSLVSNRRQ